ncbi:heat shock factor protein 4 [Maylandia zebra]|uniref:HSF-type DNA-binding domain-containing protein n=1 Tax=Astatotilapia calliptera TaxID=8154 RepID=A0A3P8PSL0_ASTCA|nr:heat shock factor protein 1 [Maylandia zebra]XP_024658775.1 heat shock factor protein 1 [Maylandia zebra]XP_026032568.1 heat shock factor protein 4 [Astatotilapia calliptera]XP_026032569.1 heat shock factor protein 4 [Astatotilapia calliptera]XP_026032570.1 heat shock factor protein 4 [Astatotilapia calliptera]
MQESPGAVGVDGSYTSNVPAFLTKLWTLVEDPDTNHLICWSATGTSFHVFDQGRFAKEVLPKYFKHNNMASFVRQLNMYGFRKVVNIEQSGLVKPERDDTEFQHLYFLQGHEHMLEHIKRKVSIVKSEETKVRQEDLSKLLYEVQLLRTQQDNMECQMQDMKQQNEVLWREVVSLRQNHTQQQKVMNKLIQFLFSQMQSNTPSTVGLKRKLPLMLDDGSPSPPASKFSHSHQMEAIHEPFYIQSPSSDTASCSASGLAGGPIISDVTDMSQASMALQMQPDETREKCMMLIKEEPVSPGVRGGGKGSSVPGGEAVALTSPCEVCSSEPPVLPVAMVQSVLEGRGSVGSMLERRSKRPALERAEVADTVENVDMSLEELQHLLLRSHQQNAVEAGTSAVMDPFSLSLPLTEWNFTEMEPNLKPYMFQNQEVEAFPAAGCEEQ